ncbi:MAG: hypothetical protein DRH50_10560 [Deltaproteobacteria bacterium]|nr:MAG: hypothetical protein DRH50_10560 [Deltaproteobacteria bacterium]
MGMTMNSLRNIFAPFWEIAPSMVCEPYREVEQAVPVRVIGYPIGDVVFKSAHPDIARVEDGILRYGVTPGATVVTAEALLDGQVHSRRYIQVDIKRPAPSSMLKWQALGNVELLPNGTWHFYYFSDWFEEDGSNIRATGRLSTPVFLNRDYLLRFDVWGEIESVDGTEFDRLELYVDWQFIRRFNPTVDIDGDPLQPYPIPRRTETVDLSQFTGNTVNLSFLWDTSDGLYQKFDGWFLADIQLIPIGGI